MNFRLAMPCRDILLSEGGKNVLTVTNGFPYYIVICNINNYNLSAICRNCIARVSEATMEKHEDLCQMKHKGKAGLLNFAEHSFEQIIGTHEE